MERRGERERAGGREGEKGGREMAHVICMYICLSNPYLQAQVVEEVMAWQG